jgi:hypothetical protein
MWTTTLLSLLLAAAPQPIGDGRAVSSNLKNVSRTIDDRVQQMTARAPFVLLGQTRGAYLPGYGAIFTLEVNLVPVAGVSPFRPAYTPQEIQNLNRQKREKIGTLRAGLRPLLAEQAAGLAQIPPGEKVALIVTLFNFHWEDPTGLPSQIVLQATRQTLLEVQARRGGPAELERAIDLKEF